MVVPEKIRVAVSGKVLTRNVGGNSSYTAALYDALAGYGVEMTPLIAPGDRWRGPARQLSYAAIEGVIWPKTTKADILHFPADTGGLIKGRMPTVATVHGVESAPVRGLRRDLWKRSWLLRTGRNASTADAVITVSRHSADEIIRTFGLPAGKIHVIPHGVDAVRFHPGQDGDAELLEPLDLPEHFVLYVGNLDPRKNVAALAEAVAAIDAHLVVAGGPFLGSAPVERALRENPKTVYLGQVRGALVAPLMRAAAVFAFPSGHEGFGMPVLEAMACGAAVLTSDRAAIPEVAGDSARMVTDLTPAGLGAALRELLSEEGARKELRDRGLARAAGFTWAESARRHRLVFDTVLRR